ncbi:hypothetical protein BGZ76_010505 [Entomortierella beljakovae]|nr:hypothetical protein BGZ76_010505 [Entomortierella beljakovae]
MLQRVSAFKPARLVSSVNRCLNNETRAFLSTSSVSADAAKVGAVYERLGVNLSDPSLMTQSVTHKSFAHGSVPTNETLGYLGRTFLELHITEQKWDKVKSDKTLKASVAHSMSTDKLTKIARTFGVDEVMRWKSPSPGKKTGEEGVLAHTMEAIVGAVYHDKGSKVAREFVNKHIYTY